MENIIKQNLGEVKCPECGNIYKKKSVNQLYCSDRCRRVKYKRPKVARKPRVKDIVDDSLPKEILFATCSCGKEYIVYKTGLDKCPDCRGIPNSKFIRWTGKINELS